MWVFKNFQPKLCMYFLTFTCVQRVSAHPIALYSTIQATSGKNYKSRRFSLPNFLQRHVTSSPFGPYTPCSIQLSGSLHSSLNMTDQTSNPQKTNPKIIVLYTYLYIFKQRTAALNILT